MKFKSLVAGLLTLTAVAAEAGNVACVGNSITYGYGLSDGKYSYPTRLQELLGDSYTVTNFGVSGMTFAKSGQQSYWSTDRFTAAMTSNPDTVVIELGTNDSKFFMGNYPDLNIYNWAYGQVSKEDLQSDYRSLIDTFMHLSSKPEIYATLQPYSNNVSWTITDTVLVNVINPIIFDAAVEKGVNIIDLHTLFHTPSWYLSDSVHPNEDGAYELAKIINSHITHAKPVISVSESTLKVDAGYAFYWYKDGKLISGANAQTYNVTEKGTYKALVKFDASTNSYLLTESVEADGSGTTAGATKVPQIDCEVKNIVAFLDSSDCGGKYIPLAITKRVDADGFDYTTTITREDGKSVTDIYPVGTTALTFTFTNEIGSVTCKDTVIVKDTLAPVFDCSTLTDITYVVDSASQIVGATNLYKVYTVSDCGSVIYGVPSRADGKSFNDTIPYGVNVINWTFTDGSGNSTVCKQNLNIVKNDLLYDCVAMDTTLEAEPCEDSAYYNAPIVIAYDLASNKYTAVGTRSDSLSMSDAFPAGVTKVTWSFTFGNKQITCPQTIEVTVGDSKSPVTHCDSLPAICLETRSDSYFEFVGYANFNSDSLIEHVVPVDTTKPLVVLKDAYGDSVLINTVYADDCSGQIAGVPTYSKRLHRIGLEDQNEEYVDWTFTGITGEIATCKQRIVVEWITSVAKTESDVTLTYADGNLYIGDNGYELLNVEVYDMQGRMVTANEIAGGESRLALGLSKGTYLIVVRNDGVKVSSLKVKE